MTSKILCFGAGVTPVAPWRNLTDDGSRVTVTKGEAVWLTLRVLPE